MIDLSHPLEPGTPVYPGDPGVEIEILETAAPPGEASGPRRANLSRLSLCVLNGTHMDAPFHFIPGGAAIDEIPLERCVGPATLLRLPHCVREGAIDAAHLAPFEGLLRASPRVVLDSSWHHRWGQPEYFSSHPVITREAAAMLLDCGIQLVGVDTPSVDREPFETHLLLLGRGILIIENLTNLDRIAGDVFQLVALPLRIVGRDGSPVRAVAMD